MATDPARGTLFVVRTNGFVGKMIRLFTRSRWNHAGVNLGDGVTVEAQPRGVAVDHVHVGQVNLNVLAQKIVELAPDGMDRLDRIAAEAHALVGKPYNFLAIAAIALSTLDLDLKLLDQYANSDGGDICSQLADVACMSAGVHLFNDGRLPAMVNPGDLEELNARGGEGITVDP